MSQDPDVREIATALRLSIALLLRRMRQSRSDNELSIPEAAALKHLEQGPMTATALAKLEQISPQSMGATLSALEVRGFIERTPDPEDGRRSFIAASAAGLQELRDHRSARNEQLARALATIFTRTELEQLAAAAPLLERLAESI